MSVLILGGNERMERNYKDLCKQYNCRAKVFTKTTGGMKNKIGTPDLCVLFTGALSHKMLQSAEKAMKGNRTVIARCPTASMDALRSVLDTYAAEA
jgi:hypothetical protein